MRTAQHAQHVAEHAASSTISSRRRETRRSLAAVQPLRHRSAGRAWAASRQRQRAMPAPSPVLPLLALPYRQRTTRRPVSSAAPTISRDGSTKQVCWLAVHSPAVCRQSAGTFAACVTPALVVAKISQRSLPESGAAGATCAASGPRRRRQRPLVINISSRLRASRAWCGPAEPRMPEACSAKAPSVAGISLRHRARPMLWPAVQARARSPLVPETAHSQRYRRHRARLPG